MKVLVHDDFGVWLAARRLNQGKFHWPSIRHGTETQLDTEQLQALVVGLPWQSGLRLRDHTALTAAISLRQEKPCR